MHRLETQLRVGFADGERYEHRRDAVPELRALALVAHRHRTEDLDRQILVELATRVEEPGERAADAREHDVVDGAVERLAHSPDALQRNAHVFDPAAAPDRTVDRQGWRNWIGGNQRADRPRELRSAVDDFAGSGNASSRQTRELHRLPEPFAHAVDHQARSIGRGRWAPFGRVENGRLPREVEHRGGDVDTGDAVGERVVRFVHEAHVFTAIDAFDEPELPQRMVAVEDLLHEPLGERDQLTA